MYLQADDKHTTISDIEFFYFNDLVDNVRRSTKRAVGKHRNGVKSETNTVCNYPPSIVNK